MTAMVASRQPLGCTTRLLSATYRFVAFGDGVRLGEVEPRVFALAR